jgi:hypothetical protein
MTHRHLFVIFVAISGGCALHPDMGIVIPRENDSYEVVSTDADKNEVLKEALYSAEVTCKRRHLRHVVTDYRTEYRGLFSEEMQPAVEQARGIIEATTGRSLPPTSRDDDYRMTMQFRCES